MTIRFLVCISSITTGLLAVPKAGTCQTPTEDAPVAVEALKDKRLVAADWKNAGFDTPQSTAQTFMWALRERDFDALKMCFSNPEKMGDPASDKAPLEEARVAVKGFQALAIRRINETTIDLKFKVQGWGDTALVHRLKKTKTGWKLDSDSSTRDANW